MISRTKRTGTSRRWWALGIAATAILVETIGIRLRGSRFGGNVVVRCRAGHLFTTIWIPGLSLKSLRLFWWRVQYCPAGHHWSLVTPVKEADLTEDQKRAAHQIRDLRIP